MRLPPFLESMPPIAYLLAVPVIAFLGAVGVTLATSDDEGEPAVVVPTVGPSLANLDVTSTAVPTATARPSPTVTTVAAPNREDCAEIQGTEYLSIEERDWYRGNCIGGGQNLATSGGGASTGGGGGTGGGGAVGHTYAVERPLGAQLVIPAAGVNTSVNITDVGENGVMPNPVGYFNALLYDFPFQPGLGGANKVVAGHVDCGACYNGGAGTAVFWSVRSLTTGATAQWINPDGSVENYVVVASYSIAANSDFSGIVASGAADLTIITCTGTFSGGEYNNRHVVQFKKV